MKTAKALGLTVPPMLLARAEALRRETTPARLALDLLHVAIFARLVTAILDDDDR